MKEIREGEEQIHVSYQKTIEGVPLIGQFNNGCGYAGVSMGLHKYGFAISPEKVFEHIHKKTFNSHAENYGHQPTLRANIKLLADAVTELTQNPSNGQQAIQPRILTTSIYKRLTEKNQNRTPHSLLKHFIDKDIPCMVRFPGHYILVIGRRTILRNGKTIEEYCYNDSLSTNRTKIMSSFGQGFELSFDAAWSRHEMGDTDGNYEKTGIDSRYLMMAFAPAKNALEPNKKAV